MCFAKTGRHEWREVADIADAAASAPGLLGVCYQNRLNPTSLRIRDELAKNTLGKMLSMKAVLTGHAPGRTTATVRGAGVLLAKAAVY